MEDRLLELLEKAISNGNENIVRMLLDALVALEDKQVVYYIPEFSDPDCTDITMDTYEYIYNN